MIEMTQAALDVLAERKRQIEVEGWSEQHDDAHGQGQMALAAATYAYGSTIAAKQTVERHCDALWGTSEGFISLIRWLWPSTWAPFWFKPKDRRYDLVRAGALIIAEIERLDRKAAALSPEKPQP